MAVFLEHVIHHFSQKVTTMIYQVENPEINQLSHQELGEKLDISMFTKYLDLHNLKRVSKADISELVVHSLKRLKGDAATKEAVNEEM